MMRDDFKVSLVANQRDEIDWSSVTSKTKATNKENLRDKNHYLLLAIAGEKTAELFQARSGTMNFKLECGHKK